jgi:hypothetical protein
MMQSVVSGVLRCVVLEPGRLWNVCSGVGVDQGDGGRGVSFW